MAPRRRLDAELVRRQLVGSRTEAQTLIAEHRVLVNGSVADKASRQVSPADAVLVDGPPARFVGRGCGEARSCAVGVRHRRARRTRPRRRRLDGRIHRLPPPARRDPRRRPRRRTRTAARTPASRSPGDEPRTVQHPSRHRRADRRTGRHRRGRPVVHLVAVVIPSLVALCQPGRPMVLLVKPQFEAGRAEVSKGKGVITIRRSTAGPGRGRRGARRRGLRCRRLDGVAAAGADGNVEYLVHAVTPLAAVEGAS